MDKKTLSHYGWLVIISLVLAIMLAFATPFGTYVGDGVVNITQALFGTSNSALNDDNIKDKGDKYSDELNKVQVGLADGKTCEHQNTTLKNKKEATCGNEGYSGDYICNDCNEIAIAGQAIPRTPHLTIETQNAIAGSCTSKSFSGNKVCKDCGEVVEKGVYSEGNAHTPEYTPMEKIHSKCSKCGVTLQTSHEFTKTVTRNATCQQMGESTYTCACGLSYTDYDIPMSDHKATFAGTKEAHTKCTWCNKTLSSQHTYDTSVAGAATCVTKGTTKYNCECGYNFNDSNIKLNPDNHEGVITNVGTATRHQEWSCCKTAVGSHSYTNKVTKEATCTSTGVRTYTCGCGYKYTQDITKNPNNHSGSVVNVGTINEHQKWNCCNTITGTHSYTSTITKTASCTEEGIKSFICSCGYSYKESIAKIGHTPINIPAVASTCKTQGLSVGKKCSVCSTIITAQTTTALNPNNHEGTVVFVGQENIHSKYNCCNKTASTTHIYTSTPIGVSTCKTGGQFKHKCECGYEYTETVAALGHNIMPAIDGVAELECSRCEALIIPSGGTYYVTPTSRTLNNYTGASKTLIGDGKTVEFPAPQNGDVFVYSDYEYKYNYYFETVGTVGWLPDNSLNGWGVRVLDTTKTSYDTIYETINEKNIITLMYTFQDCSSMLTSPKIPKDVINLIYTYSGCNALLSAPDLNHLNELKNIQGAFLYCYSLTKMPEIPNTVTDMRDTFAYCYSLTDLTNVSSSAVNMWGTFYYCSSITDVSDLNIPNTVTSLVNTFNGCTSLGGFVNIDANPTEYISTFYDTSEKIYLVGSSSVLQELAATDGYTDYLDYDNVRIVIDNPLPNGTLYEVASTNSDGTYAGPKQTTYGLDIIYKGDGLTIPWPTPSVYDMYTEGEYNYCYKSMHRATTDDRIIDDDTRTYNWSMHVKDNTQYSYGKAKEEINGLPVDYARVAYMDCYNMVTAPALPESVYCIQDTYMRCYSLQNVPVLSDNITIMYGAFIDCTALKTIPNFPNNITGLYWTFKNCSTLTSIPSISSSVSSFNEAFLNCTNLEGYIEISAPSLVSYGNAFYGTTKKIYLYGNCNATHLSYLAASDGYTDLSDLDNVRVLADNLIPAGATYYVQPTTNKLNQYTGATQTLVGDGLTVYYPTPQNGDAMVYGEYEYRYNQYMDFWSYDASQPDGEWNFWCTDENQGGWGVRVRDKSKTTYGPMLERLGYKNVVALTSTFEDCRNLVKLQEGFKLPSKAVRFDQMFDQCVSMTSLPNSFKFGSSAENLEWMFYECTSLSFANYSCSDGSGDFLIPGTVKDMYQMFMHSTNLGGTIRIDAVPDRYKECFNKINTEVYITGTSTVLAEIADQDDDNVVHCKYVPVGGTYYDINTSDAHYIKNFKYLGVYNVGGNSVTQTVVGDGLTTEWPTITAGDIFKYKGYEYRYNMEAEIDLKTNVDAGQIWVDRGYIVTDDKWVDSSIGGWGARAFNYKDVITVEPVLKSIYKPNVTSLKSLFENFANLEYLDEDFIVSKYVVSTNQMFDECYSLESLPANFNLNGSGLKDAGGTFWACIKLTSLPTGFYVGENVENIAFLFDGCAVEGVVDIRTNKITNPSQYAYALGSYKDALSYGRTYVDTSKITNIIGTDYAQQIMDTKDSWSGWLVDPTY